MATVTNYYSRSFSPSLDGYAARTAVNQTFSNIRSGAGTTSSSVSGLGIVQIDSSSTTNQFSDLYRTITLFDTSSIPTGATITSASISLYGTTKSNGLGSTTLDIVSSSPASNLTIANADYGVLGSTSFASISYASFATSAYNTFTLNSSGIANISKGGISKFGFLLGWDLSGSFAGSWISTSTAYFGWNNGNASNNRPILTVNWTLSFPSLSINNVGSLQNLTTITTS